MTTSLLDRLAAAFRNADQVRLRQAEREALVDLLVWTMFVDRRIAISEQNMLLREAGELPWESLVSVENYIDGATGRARDVLGNAAAEERYLADIAARLSEPSARAQAIEACERLVRADGDVAELEAAHIARVRRAFGLEGAR